MHPRLPASHLRFTKLKQPFLHEFNLSYWALFPSTVFKQICTRQKCPMQARGMCDFCQLTSNLCAYVLDKLIPVLPEEWTNPEESLAGSCTLAENTWKKSLFFSFSVPCRIWQWPGLCDYRASTAVLSQHYLCNYRELCHFCAGSGSACLGVAPPAKTQQCHDTPSASATAPCPSIPAGCPWSSASLQCNLQCQ